MSSTPPGSGPVPTNAAGDGVEIKVDEARSGQRSGRVVWILAISLLAIVLIFAVYLIINARHMQQISHPAGRDLNAHDASTYQTPPPSARPSPSGQVGNTGQ